MAAKKKPDVKKKNVKKADKAPSHYREPINDLQILRHPERFGYLARIRHFNEFGEAMIADPVTYSPIDPGQCLENYGRCFNMRQEDAQNLMDNLWQLGIRPELRYTLGDILEMQSEAANEMRNLKKTLKDVGPMDSKYSGLRGKILRWILKTVEGK